MKILTLLEIKKLCGIFVVKWAKQFGANPYPSGMSDFDRLIWITLLPGTISTKQLHAHLANATL